MLDDLTCLIFKSIFRLARLPINDEPTYAELLRASDYMLNNTIFRVCYGNDITKEEAEVLVKATDNFGGVYGPSRAIEAEKYLPPKAGDIAVTSAGNLGASYVFHVVTAGHQPKEEDIVSITRKCLERADNLNVKSIAFPAFWFSGIIDPYVMPRTIAEYLMGETKIEVVILFLLFTQNWFYGSENLRFARAAARASVYTQSKKLVAIFDELESIFYGPNETNFLGQVRMLKSDIFKAQEVLSKQPQNMERLKQKQLISHMKNISENIINLASDVIEVNEWSDKQQEAKLMRFKLEGLYTLLNISTCEINTLVSTRAKSSDKNSLMELGIDIANAKKKIDNLGKEINQTRRRLETHDGHIPIIKNHTW
jgi:hypothetical protein